ncbi:hypothetical protein [Kribbella shirazensis]|uniref:Putative PurR-regulated permease PerM n=1 Tax=Kribbella shirazensis TaxID=1105143 RepID=A0A7X6A362_9ACTN|nr:hypothetical protein [Kribbella shirazensis]NIK58999.1 putative PurR-regulated permease PerM [Kribbella shirazensis]
MDSQEHATVLGARTTERYVLQSAAGSAISEAGSRPTAFVLTVSSSLVAIGFTVHDDRVFWPFVSAVLPLLFGLGAVTTIRLVETGVQGLMYQQAIARIRRYYRNLDTDHAVYFSKFSRHSDPPDTTEALAMLAAKQRPEVFSIACTTALITTAIAGIGTALLIVRIAGRDALPIAYPVGAAAFVLLMTAFFTYERARYGDVVE